MASSHAIQTTQPSDVEQFNKLAQRFKLLTTGGSDYHGSRKTISLGSQKVPFTAYENLLNAHTT